MLGAIRALTLVGSPAFVYLGAIVSYACVLVRAYSNAQISLELLNRLLLDENVLYWTLAASLLAFTDDLIPFVVPFATYSMFHAVSYFTSALLPLLFPHETRSSAVKEDQQHWVVRMMTRVDTALREYYTPIIKFIAVYEITFLPVYLLFFTLTFQIPLSFLLFYTYFIYNRYRASHVLRLAFLETREYLDGRILQGNAPPIVEQMYTKLKQVLDTVAPKGFVVEASSASSGVKSTKKKRNGESRKTNSNQNAKARQQQHHDHDD